MVQRKGTIALVDQVPVLSGKLLGIRNTLIGMLLSINSLENVDLSVLKLMLGTGLSLYEDTYIRERGDLIASAVTSVMQCQVLRSCSLCVFYLGKQCITFGYRK